jgi:hypothetical protein
MSDILTGERFEALADILVLERSRPNNHPTLKCPPLSTKKFLYIENAPTCDLSSIHASSRVFVYSNILPAFFRFIFPRLQHPITLLSHNSDAEITEEYRKYLDSPMLLMWYGQNAKLYHEKVVAVPIGIANSQWAHGNIEVLHRVMNENIPKRNDGIPFVCFAVHTNRTKREPIASALAARGWPNIPCTMNYETYLRTMASFRFAISPPGNGVDCHRFWECIYLGIIPIVEDHPFYDHWEGIPILRVKNWNTFDIPYDMTFTLSSQRHLLSYYSSLL